VNSRDSAARVSSEMTIEAHQHEPVSAPQPNSRPQRSQRDI